MTTVRIEYFGVDGEGRNVTEAKKNAGKKLDRIVRNLSPSVFCHKGHTLVVYPNAAGCFSYTFTHPNTEGYVAFCSCGGESRDDVIASGIVHLLSITRNEGEFDIPGWAECYLDCKSVRKEWAGNDAFQRAYRHAQEQGEPDPHQWACWNRGRFAEEYAFSP